MKIKLSHFLLILSVSVIIGSGISYLLSAITITISGPLMNVTGSVPANFWRGKPVEESNSK